MIFVRQPKNSNQCGQACIAMLGNISLDDACLLTGTRGATRTKHLSKALTDLNISHAPRRRRGIPTETALLYVQSKDRTKAHWVLWHNKKYYDPAAGVFRKLPVHLEEADMTSYLEVIL